MNIFEKLLAIQTELKAPKSQYNDFGKYKYRNCEDILEAAKPICADNKAVLTLTDDIVLIGERYYVKAIATLTDCEKPEDKITVTANAREEDIKKGMDGSQVTGASSSYARKYALNGLFNIDDTKGSDSTNKGDSKDSAPKKVGLPAPEFLKPEVKLMNAIQKAKMAELNVKLSDVATYFKVDESEITEDQAADIIKRKTPRMSNVEKLKGYCHNDTFLMSIGERLIPTVGKGKKLEEFNDYDMGQLFLGINTEVRNK